MNEDMKDKTILDNERIPLLHKYLEDFARKYQPGLIELIKESRILHEVNYDNWGNDFEEIILECPTEILVRCDDPRDCEGAILELIHRAVSKKWEWDIRFCHLSTFSTVAEQGLDDWQVAEREMTKWLNRIGYGFYHINQEPELLAKVFRGKVKRADIYILKLSEVQKTTPKEGKTGKFRTIPIIARIPIGQEKIRSRLGL